MEMFLAFEFFESKARRIISELKCFPCDWIKRHDVAESALVAANGRERMAASSLGLTYYEFRNWLYGPRNSRRKEVKT